MHENSKSSIILLLYRLSLINRLIRAEGVKEMKQGIHPEYNRINVVCTTCGNEFESGSVKKEIRVDTCSNCHPFYTGRQKFAQADGRIERFNKKYGINSK